MSKKLEPIAPDSVHVWRGYKIPSQTYKQFSEFLGERFVPACCLLQPNIGLHAYVPSMPSQIDKPLNVPDQTALMFWKSPEIYKEGFKTVAVRTYTSMHSLVYDDTSKSGFPIAFEGVLEEDQPYYLINQKADWMHGSIRHLVGSKKDNQTQQEFLTEIGQWVKQYHESPSSGADGSLLCIGKGFVVFWEHWPEDSICTDSAFNELAKMVTPFLKKMTVPTELPAGLWNQWAGFDLATQDCMNVQLNRPSHIDDTIPVMQESKISNMKQN